jgi:hypothetical protein
MDDLIAFYERELGQLRGSLAEFAERFPKAAARLSISGQRSEDHHVERMIESAALLNARVTARLEDEVPEFTKPLLEIAYPEYLRSFPSCAIACFESSPALARLTKPAVIKRRAELKTRTGEYPFETVYDVTLAPMRVAGAMYQTPTSAPSNLCLPKQTTAVLSISFEALDTSADLRNIAPQIVRIFVDGNPTMVASTIDALLQRALGAFLEVNGSGRWIALPGVPFSPVRERVQLGMPGHADPISDFEVTHTARPADTRRTRAMRQQARHAEALIVTRCICDVRRIDTDVGQQGRKIIACGPLVDPCRRAHLIDPARLEIPACAPDRARDELAAHREESDRVSRPGCSLGMIGNGAHLRLPKLDRVVEQHERMEWLRREILIIRRTARTNKPRDTFAAA